MAESSSISPPKPIRSGQTGPRSRLASISGPLSSLVEAGGPNSFSNFAKSWQRAATFNEPSLVRQALVDSDDEDEYDEVVQDDAVPAGSTPPRNIPSRDTESAEESSAIMGSYPANSLRSQIENRLQYQRRNHHRRTESFLADVLPGSSVPGSMLPQTNALSRKSSINQSGRLRRRPLLEAEVDEVTPLLSKAKETGDSIIILGQSTLPQTMFNSVNILVGMSMLALPYGIRLSGWVIGGIYFTFVAVVTCHTAKLLGKCLDVDDTGALSTFDDIAYVSFGRRGRLAVSLLFNVLLLVVCIGFFILGADTFHVLIPSVSIVQWKLIFGAIAIPLCMLPMHIMSFTSIVGIMSSVSIILLVLIGGITKTSGVGSLHQPAHTNWFPDNWLHLPKALGVFMASFGAHSVFPNIYKDMRHPQKYGKAVNRAFGFAYFSECIVGIAGYLMFGMATRPELTESMLRTPGFAPWILKLVFVAIAAMPLTKIPLNARPVITTILTLLRLDPRSLSTKPPSFRDRALSTAIYVAIPASFSCLSVLVPNFDLIVSLMGTMECALISIILPCLFHLRLFGGVMTKWELARDWGIVVFFSFPMVIGTVFTFLPDEMLGGW